MTSAPENLADATPNEQIVADEVEALDLVSRAEVLRVIRSLGNQDADLALYGADDNARAREYGEAAATRACCAIALMPSAKLTSETEESAKLRARVEELEGALRPFVKLMSDIPADLPDDLWTTCSTYQYDMSEDEYLGLIERGVFLKSRKTSLALWIDGHSIGDFRRARSALGGGNGE